MSTKLPRSLTAPLVLFCLSFLLYRPTLTTFFISDDFSLLRALQKDGPFGIWTHGWKFFRPLMSLNLYLDFRLWGLSPTGYHISNILLHGINGVLVTLLCAETRRAFSQTEGTIGLSEFGAGLLFTVWPWHGESVAWISGRTDVLASTFALASMWAYFRFRNGANTPRYLLTISGFAFLLALGCKESAAAVPLVFLGYELSHKLRGEPVFRPAIWFFALVVIYLPVRSMMMGTSVGGYGLITAPRVLAHNLALGTFVSLSPRLPQKMLYVVATAGWVLLYAFGYRKSDSAATVRWLALVFIILALPTLVTGTVVLTGENERFMYLPSAVACCMMALILEGIGRKAGTVALAGLVLVGSVQTYESATLWARAGVFTHVLLDDLGKTLPARRVLVANVPDSLNGVYVYRNGYRDAAELFFPGKFSAFATASIVEIPNGKAPIPWTKFLSGIELSEMRKSDGTCGIKTVLKPKTEVPAVYKQLDGCRLQVLPSHATPEDRLLVYSAGHMVSVPSQLPAS